MPHEEKRRRFGRVLLYVGPPKTGTTSNQRFVWKNRDALIAQGIYAPRTGVGGGQHIDLPAIMAALGKKEARKNRLNFQAQRRADEKPSEAPADDRKQLFLAKLDAELTDAPACHTLLMMSEAIFPCGGREVRRYRELFAPFADRFESLMYLRRQDRWLASRTLQNRKSGNRPDLELNVGSPESFARSVQAWHSKSDRCLIRRFEPATWPENSLIRDFCNALGADPTGLDMTEVRTNPALVQEQLELVDAINAKIKDFPFRRQSALRRRLLALAVDNLGGAKIAFPRDVAEAAFAAFEPINRWLRDTIDPAGPPLFFDADFSDYEAAPANDRRYSMEQLASLLTLAAPGARPEPTHAQLVEQIVAAVLTGPGGGKRAAR